MELTLYFHAAGNHMGNWHHGVGFSNIKRVVFLRTPAMLRFIVMDHLTVKFAKSLDVNMHT
jgi:hypothetical protein